MRFGLDGYFGVHEQSLILHSQRAQVLAENLANADTPNYKARDLDFKATLKDASDSVKANGLNRTHAKHISMETEGAFGSTYYERTSSQPSLDGNTVDAQIEQSAFLRNAVEYQVGLKLLSGKIKGLMSAIRGD